MGRGNSDLLKHITIGHGQSTQKMGIEGHEHIKQDKITTGLSFRELLFRGCGNKIYSC